MHYPPKLKVLILGLNYAPELVGIAVYTTDLAQSLVRRGHSVRVVAGKPYYPTWSPSTKYGFSWAHTTCESGVDVTRVAHYVPTSPTGLRRILHHLSFALLSLLPSLIAAHRQRPDIVIAVAPALIAAPVARLAAWVARARSWLHLQDFEVDAAIATGLLPDHGPVAALSQRCESAVYRMFDRVSTISPTMCGRLQRKGVPASKIVEFRNWASNDHVVPLKTPSPFQGEWRLTSRYVALYSGNIGAKQGLETVIAAAQRLQSRNDLIFVICGEGPYRADLEALAAGLNNIRFRSLQPKERLGDLLGLATVHLLPQRAAVDGLVLPSKLSNMLASGRPVVATAAPGSSLADEVDGCGLVVPPGDGDALARAVSALVDNASARAAFGLAARRRAEERWEREAIIGAFEERVREMLSTIRFDERPEEFAPVYQDLSAFSVAPGFRGRPGAIVLLWQLVQATLFRLSPQPLYAWRRALLRLFGAEVGSGVLVRPSARVTYPWKVRLGDHCWIGDSAELYSLGPISIGANAVVSQKTYICAATHDSEDLAFPLLAAPVTIEPECWIAADCFVGPGVTIRHGAVVAARSTVRSDIPAGTVAAGSPATVRKFRRSAHEMQAVRVSAE